VGINILISGLRLSLSFEIAVHIFFDISNKTKQVYRELSTVRVKIRPIRGVCPSHAPEKLSSVALKLLLSRLR